MKCTLFLVLIVSISSPLFSQLMIYSEAAQSGTSATCEVGTIYKSATIPGSLHDEVSSIQLQQGYMATLAENEDGSGAAYTFIAAVSNVSVNLNKYLDNKVSFIRVLPFRNTMKKGAGLTNNAHIDPLNVSWFYDWGFNDVSLLSREYALMSWGKTGVTNSANLTSLINKSEVSHLLSFNEPDNTGQSNIAANVADTLHEKLAQTGLRLGSPAPTESQAFVWLPNFMARTRTENIKVDFMAVHWYDWGSWLQTLNVEPNVASMFTRFKNYITYVYAMYGKPIWITEFNANPNTTSATHEAFMALALPWLEAQPFVERYAYFFPSVLPPVDGLGYVTPIGQAYKNFNASTPSIVRNYDNSELLMEDVNTIFEAEQAIIYNTGTAIANCATSSGGQMANAVTGNLRIGFHEINVPATGTYDVDVRYLTTGARTLTARVNHAAAQTFNIPASGPLWCYEGGSPGTHSIPLSLLAGNNSIEFTVSPTIDYIKVIPNLSLPVSLFSFSGVAQQKSIDLNWQTSQEKNSLYFEVLKSKEGNHFISIGKKNAAGNTNAGTYYQFKDEHPFEGTNMYKLKTVDKDGSYTYSKTVAIQYNYKATSLWLISSTSHSIKVAVFSPTNEKATINLVGIDGKILSSKHIMLNNGTNFIEIPTTMAIGGVAIVNLRTSNTAQSIKMVK